MKISIDTNHGTFLVEEDGRRQEHALYGRRAFEILSKLWLKAGWDLKYSYDFQWLGRPVIQMPEDLIRLQELIWTTRPTVVVETGVAHGGSTVFFASMMEILGAGRVISVEVELRPQNRKALEEHPLRPRLTLIEASSVSSEAVEQVRESIGAGERVMVILDSNHSRAHVARELELYAPLVTPGCYLVVADGVMTLLHDVPRGRPEWKQDNPLQAAQEFLATHPQFQMDPSYTRTGITYFHGGYLRRLS
ncbi:MAG: cephalosporin hydroxylase family protein [Acidobacteriota bacterium]